MKVSIIIVDYRKASSVVANIKTLLKSDRNFDIEIIVLDNSENQKNAEILQKNLSKIPTVKLFIAPKNQGYTAGNNWAAKRADGEILGIVNPDIAWNDSKALSALVAYIQKNEEVGVVGPKQLDPNEKTVDTARKFPGFFELIWRRIFPTREKKLADKNAQKVDWLQSSCIFLSRKLWDDIGGFDEKYFLFMGDVELCRDTWKRGKKVIFLPDAVVSTDGIRLSSGNVLDFFRKPVLRQHFYDAVKYFWSHKGQKKPSP